MKVLAASSYGPVEQLKTFQFPIREPGMGEVRVRVAASALNPADYKVIEGSAKFLHGGNLPLAVGYDFSGTVEALGAQAGPFKIGDEVFGFLYYGMKNRQGAFAETLIAKAGEIALKPAAVSHHQVAAAATPGLTALQSLRDLGRLPGQGARVLITGVSGGVGSIGISVAKRLGASVTAIGAGGGLALAKKLGAETVIDRKTQDVYSQVKGLFDVIFDAAAAYRWSDWSASLKPDGVYITTLPSLDFLVDKIHSLLSPSTAKFVMVKSKAADLQLLGEWLADGLEVKVDSVIAVKDVAQNLARLRKGEVVGRVVVDIPGQFGV